MSRPGAPLAKAMHHTYANRKMPDDRVKQRKPRLRYVEPEVAAELAGRQEAKRRLTALTVHPFNDSTPC